MYDLKITTLERIETRLSCDEITFDRETGEVLTVRREEGRSTSNHFNEA